MFNIGLQLPSREMGHMYMHLELREREREREITLHDGKIMYWYSVK